MSPYHTCLAYLPMMNITQLYKNIHICIMIIKKDKT